MTDLKVQCVLQQSIDALHNTKNALMFICGGEIIRMAREAGLNIPDRRNDLWVPQLERFAALVAAHEREACAKVCEANKLIDMPTAFEIAAVRKCAAAIRARGNGD